MKFLIFLLLCGIFIAFIVINIYVNKHKNLPERCEETRCRLEDWRVSFIGNDRYVFGNIYDHPEYTDGKPIRFGPIDYNISDDLVRTANLDIQLGSKAK